MQIDTWREARFKLVCDQLIAQAQRLGFLNIEQLKALEVGELDDGWFVRVDAAAGIGLSIKHTLDVEIWHPTDPQESFRFTIDVYGQSKCKNCYFPVPGRPKGMDVNTLEDDEFESIVMLPDLFGDFVATQMLAFYKKEAK